MKKSWKTSLAGVIAAVGESLTSNEDPTIAMIGKGLAMLGLVLVGMFARDNNVSSQQAGIRPPVTQPIEPIKE